MSVENILEINNAPLKWKDRDGNAISVQIVETGCSTDGSIVMIDPNNQQQNTNEVDMIDIERGVPGKVLWPNIDDNGIFHCPRCSYQTERKANWYKHKQTHLGGKKHQCPHCAYSTTSASNMRRHNLKHEGIKKFGCPVCNAAFRQKTHLQRHQEKTHIRRKFPCVACAFSGATEEELARHINRKHKDLVLVPSEDPSQKPNVTTRSYLCPYCAFMSIDRRIVQQHMKFHDTEGAELKMFCKKCSFITNSKSRLMRHELTHSHEKPFACRLCQYKANQKHHVIRHLKAIHKVVVNASGKEMDNYATNNHNSNIIVNHSGNGVTLGNMHGVSVNKGSNGRKTKRKLGKPLVVATEDIIPSNKMASGNSTNESDETGQNKLVKDYNVINTVDPSLYNMSKKLFACNFCTMTFSKLINLYKHVHLQHKAQTDVMNNLSCVICDFSGNNYNSLLAHMRRHTASEEAKMASRLFADQGNREEQHEALVQLLNQAGATVMAPPPVQINDKRTVMIKMADDEETEFPVIVEIPNFDNQETSSANPIEFVESTNDMPEQDSDFVYVNDPNQVIQRITNDKPLDTFVINASDETNDMSISSINVSNSTDVVESTAINNSCIKQRVEENSCEVEITEQCIVGEEVAEALIVGDLIEINGETYKVEMSHSV